MTAADHIRILLLSLGGICLLGAVIGTCVQGALHDHKTDASMGRSQIKFLILAIVLLVLGPLA